MLNHSDATLLARQDELQSQGRRLLAASGVSEILSRHGKVELGGSYVYGLMTYPDIDLGVISEEPTKEHFGAMVGELTALSSVRKVKTSDRVNHTHKRQKAITGYWIGLEINFENTIWNLDIWYQKPEWQNDKTAEWLDKLSAITDEQRSAILRMKEELRAQGRYGVGKEFVAVDVYRAVLERNLRSTGEFT